MWVEVCEKRLRDRIIVPALPLLFGNTIVFPRNGLRKANYEILNPNVRKRVKKWRR